MISLQPFDFSHEVSLLIFKFLFKSYVFCVFFLFVIDDNHFGYPAPRYPTLTTAIFQLYLISEWFSWTLKLTQTFWRCSFKEDGFGFNIVCELCNKPELEQRSIGRIIIFSLNRKELIQTKDSYDRILKTTYFS